MRACSHPGAVDERVPRLLRLQRLEEVRAAVGRDSTGRWRGGDEGRDRIWHVRVHIVVQGTLPARHTRLVAGVQV